MHHMALGETIGFSTLLTQNNGPGGLYQNQMNSCAGQIHIALMGDPTLRMQYQTIRLRADTAGRVTWQVNNRRIPSPEWPLVPGKHTITAIDESGRRDSVSILVK